MEKNRSLLIGVARIVSLLSTFAIPFLALYSNISPSSAIGNPYEASVLVISLQLFLTPLLWFPFFVLNSSYFKLVRIPLITYGTVWLFIPLSFVFGAVGLLNLSAGPTLANWTFVYFCPNISILILGFLICRRNDSTQRPLSLALLKS